jgi:hypothetical protein
MVLVIPCHESPPPLIVNPKREFFYNGNVNKAEPAIIAVTFICTCNHHKTLIIIDTSRFYALFVYTAV